MADFDLLKVKVKNRFFSLIKKHLLSQNGVVWDIAHQNRFSRLGCTRVKERKKVKKKYKKKHKTLYVAYVYLTPWKFFWNQISLDYLGRWRN